MSSSTIWAGSLWRYGQTGASSFIEVNINETSDLTIYDCQGKVINTYGQTAAMVLTLPACIKGLSGSVIAGAEGQGAVSLKPNGTDIIYLDGVELDAGDKVTLETPEVGNFFTFSSFKDDSGSYVWSVISGLGYLIDGGA